MRILPPPPPAPYFQPKCLHYFLYNLSQFDSAKRLTTNFKTPQNFTPVSMKLKISVKTTTKRNTCTMGVSKIAIYVIFLFFFES